MRKRNKHTQPDREKELTRTRGKKEEILGERENKRLWKRKRERQREKHTHTHTERQRERLQEEGKKRRGPET